MTNDEGMTKSKTGKIVSDNASSFEHSDFH